jgi:deoxycytidine triphosphate deaminase
MPSPIRTAADGLQRAAIAVEDELSSIRSIRPREAFPHSELISALPKAGELIGQTNRFIDELRLTSSDHIVTTFKASAKVLAGLHHAVQKLRSTVEWSSKFTAIDWWVARRTDQLLLGEKRVLVAPGPIDRFHVESISEFGSVLKRLGTNSGMLTDENGKMLPEFQSYVTAINNYHILTVPSYDGMSPLWHPLFLGHEIAHLKYSEETVEAWLSTLPPEELTDLQRSAVRRADESRSATGGRTLRPLWYKRLLNWLVEIACDSTAQALYGDGFLQALKAFLAAYSNEGMSDTHPSLEFRIAVQLATGSSDLASFEPDDAFEDLDSHTLEAVCAFATPLRDAVMTEIRSCAPIDSGLVNDVSASTEQALRVGSLPASCDWATESLSNMASSVESGMVQGLWNRREHAGDEGMDAPPEITGDVERVSHAIDALEFMARFEERAREAGHLERDPQPCNVLWVTKQGVKIRHDEENGRPSHDLRLGRYFIVFQRNEVAFLDPLDPSKIPSVIQREVEVGWGEKFTLHPSELVLAATFESMRVDEGCAAQVLSRSSLGRLGLLSATAVQVHPGFVGCLTLELANLASVPLRLTPGQRIAQLVPALALGSDDGYTGYYQDAGRRPEYSLSHNDWDADVLRTITFSRPT